MGLCIINYKIQEKKIPREQNRRYPTIFTYPFVMFDFHTGTLLAMAAIFAGSFVQTSIGFGLGIVAAPLIIHISPDYVPVPIIIIALLLSLLVTLKNRSGIEIGGLKTAMLGRIPGAILGAIALTYISASVLSLWLGITVLLSLGVNLLPFRIQPTPRRMGIAGFISGFMGTTSSIGGPPMAILLQHQEANQFRGNLSAFFLFSSFISLVFQYAVGYLNWNHIMISIPLVLPTLLGFWLGAVCAPHISKNWVRRGALVLCLVSGLGAIYQSF